MSKEILFRAKKCTNGEWVKGNLYNAEDGTYIISPNSRKKKDYILIIEYLTDTIEFECWDDVDPETVCQYTRLKDKSGKRIFEGDILNVTYSDQQGECHHTENYVLNDLRNTSIIGWLDYANELEIVGNIFDNPELLS